MRINDSTVKKYRGDIFGRSRGLVPRDYRKHPVNSIQWDATGAIISREFWPELIAEQIDSESRISDIRRVADYGQAMESLDQGQEGFCWAYSTVACMMLTRAVANMPYERLSPHAIGCKLMNFRNRGAWGALSMEFVSRHGCPNELYWPQQSMSRANDNDECWDDARRFKVTEGYLDIKVDAWDADLGFDLIASLLLQRVPCVLDFDWWGHSVCGMDLIDLDNGKPVSDIERWGIRILNSWSDSWGEDGEAIIEGRKCIPMGSCAARVLMGESDEKVVEE